MITETTDGDWKVRSETFMRHGSFINIVDYYNPTTGERRCDEIETLPSGRQLFWLEPNDPPLSNKIDEMDFGAES